MSAVYGSPVRPFARLRLPDTRHPPRWSMIREGVRSPRVQGAHGSQIFWQLCPDRF